MSLFPFFVYASAGGGGQKTEKDSSIHRPQKTTWIQQNGTLCDFSLNRRKIFSLQKGLAPNTLPIKISEKTYP